MPTKEQPNVIELNCSSDEGIEITPVETKANLPTMLPSYRSRTAKMMKFDPKKIPGFAQKENDASNALATSDLFNKYKPFNHANAF